LLTSDFGTSTPTHGFPDPLQPWHSQTQQATDDYEILWEQAQLSSFTNINLVFTSHNWDLRNLNRDLTINIYGLKRQEQGPSNIWMQPLNWRFDQHAKIPSPLIG
jgi:hypothetical protein